MSIPIEEENGQGEYESGRKIRGVGAGEYEQETRRRGGGVREE